MYGWTKKFKSMTWWDFFKLVQELKDRYETNDKVLYFKIVVKDKDGISEHCSLQED